MNSSKKIFFISSFIVVNFIGNEAFSYDKSIKEAFCNDHAAKQSSFFSGTKKYDFQVAYVECMKKAGKLIRKFEKQKELDKKRQKERAKQLYEEMLRNEKIRKEKEAIQLELKRKQEAKERESILDLQNNIERIFD